MPEQLTKHPEVTLQVLRSAQAQCGAGAAQDILRSCPAARFCKLPGGEICVHGVADAPRMTQFSTADWRQLAALVNVDSAPAAAPALGTPLLIGGTGLLIGVVIGLVAARFWARR
jgi:hypothetical protein